MNRYPLWKNLMVVAVLLLGIIYALPNVFGEDPAVQISHLNSTSLTDELPRRIEEVLKQENLGYRSMAHEQKSLLIRFTDPETQLKARDLLAGKLGQDYVVALNLAPRTPAWLRAIGARPMALGLDLRGGVHFLMEVDEKAALAQAVARYESDIRRLLRTENIHYLSIERRTGGLSIRLMNAAEVARARAVLTKEYNEFALNTVGDVLELNLNETEQKTVGKRAVEQNITTLRNRVNELGVAEPVIQRQGQNKIVVELPGVQDTARAKEILGATATLEFHLADVTVDAAQAQQPGKLPADSRIYRTREGQPVVLKREVIVRGNQLIDAASGFDREQGTPAVFVTLDSAGARRMGDTTRENIGKPMAVVFVETRTDTELQNGQPVKVRRTIEQVINVATIRDVFSKRFQITGLQSEEARNLALLLRAGSLAAPVDIVEERTIGPSLGQRNIQQGFMAALIGFLLVAVFMGFYYRLFGLVADLALLFNVIIVIALLSLIQATLTLPGIAGIVLTVGMAVDANVLINERIREELRRGNSPQASIHAGYARAFATITDSNVTTLIAALVLFGIGTGSIRGFAVTLTLGILTSMFTAIMGSRALINLIYGGRRVSRLSI